MKCDYPRPDPQLMQFLLALYQAHNCVASWQGDWIKIDNGRLFTRAASFKENQHSDLTVLQADFLTVTSAGHHILESFAGWGQDAPAALRDVCQSFVDSSFHAILAALLGQLSEQADTLQWGIRGIPRLLTFGSLRLRGDFPMDSWPTLFEVIESEMKRSDVQKGLHWVRYFYSYLPGKAPVIEVLLDNEPWGAMQEQVASFPWPVTQEFYSARLFVIIQDVAAEPAKIRSLLSKQHSPLRQEI
jgi:hypothetical protein